MRKFPSITPDQQKSRVALFFIMVLGVLLIVGCVSAAQTQVSGDRDKLEVEKLMLEVSRLRQEQQLFAGSRILSYAGSILGSIAILWTIGQGYQTLRNQTASQKQSRIAEILTSLSSGNEMTRIGAARSLSRYPDDTLDEILSALRFEKSSIVRDVLEDTLEKISPKNFSSILNANTKTLEERISLFGCLSSLKARNDYSMALLRLTDHSAKAMLENRNYRFRYDHGFQSQMHEQKLLKELGEPPYKNNELVLQKCQQATDLARSTGKIISKLLRAGHKIAPTSTSLDLTASNLYRIDLHGVQLPNSIFARSIMRHVDLQHAYLAHSDFSVCNMYESTLSNADLSYCSLVRVNLLDIEAMGAKFQHADLTGANFSRGHLDKADFRHSTGTNIKMNGINSQAVLFDDCEWKSSRFDGSTLVHSFFRNARLFQATFKSSKILDSDLQEVRLNGADLSRAKFSGSDFLNADLSGADLKRADFRGAKNISTVKMDGVRNFESALFDPGVEIRYKK
jgi:uncharacterized protein YjbI with pentapeptide repeats